MRDIYELNSEPINQNEKPCITTSQLWGYRQPATVESLKLAVQLKVAAGDSSDILILAKILDQVYCYFFYCFEI